MGIQRKRVNSVLDADIRGFFDNMSHEWTMKFIEHRVADRRMLRLIQKWLKAGVSEDGQWSETRVGTPQGAVVSPLLANVYLHYVFDLWVEAWRKKAARGDVIVVRYADDPVMGFQSRADTERFLAEFRELRKHHRTSDVSVWLRKVLEGYCQYHAVPGNTGQWRVFGRRVCRLWRSVLVRRSQRAQVGWPVSAPCRTGGFRIHVFYSFIPTSASKPFILGKSRMRQRARTDLCRGAASDGRP